MAAKHIKITLRFKSKRNNFDQFDFDGKFLNLARNGKDSLGNNYVALRLLRNKTDTHDPSFLESSNFLQSVAPFRDELARLRECAESCDFSIGVFGNSSGGIVIGFAVLQWICNNNMKILFHYYS